MLGVLANSDGRAEKVQAVVNIFLAEGAAFAIHCGDIGGRHVLDALAPIGGAFVWGDRDHDRTGLLRYGTSLGLTCWGMLGEFDDGEKKLCIIHGDNKPVLRRLIDEQQYDYILCGHEMTTSDQTTGRTRILNPGPLHGATSSAMLLDPYTGKLRIVPM
ncbi:MAG TPA: metallophosphoesterase family protein [Tepidisphaeraceae bacterium]|jgi:predicted phosphodiesterase